MKKQWNLLEFLIVAVFQSLGSAELEHQRHPSAAAFSSRGVNVHETIVRDKFSSNITVLPCGSYRLLAGEYQIESPGFPGDYPNHSDCDYDIRGRVHQSFTFFCDVFSLEAHPRCAWDWLLLSVNENCGTKYCGNSGPPSLNATRMQIQFVSDYSKVFNGYRCRISVSSVVPLPCGDLVLPTGLYRIQSPGFPAAYQHGVDCLWRLSTPPERHHVFNVNCTAFHLESHPTCEFDWLAVNGYDRRYCGRTSVRGSSPDSLRLHFHSDHSVSAAGFMCEVAVLENTCCGLATTAADSGSKVTGGAPLPTPHLYPWLSALVRVGEDRSFCGASVLSDRYLVTAAHCTHGLRAADIQVLLHVHDVHAAGKLRRNVSDIWEFPGYASVKGGYDVAILLLSERLNLSSVSRDVAPVCLTDHHLNPLGANATVAGWGSSFLGGPSVSRLRHTQLTVIADSDCQQRFGNDITLQSSMLCALRAGSGACSGDSGGPLVVPTSGRMTLVGVVSFARGCGSTRYPSVYGRLSKALDWIRQVTFDSQYCPSPQQENGNSNTDRKR